MLRQTKIYTVTFNNFVYSHRGFVENVALDNNLLNCEVGYWSSYILCCRLILSFMTPHEDKIYWMMYVVHNKKSKRLQILLVKLYAIFFFLLLLMTWFRVYIYINL